MALVELTAEMTHAELIATLNTNLNFVANRFRIGDTITTSNPDNPGLYFGGTWELCSVGKTIVGYDEEDEDFDTIGATGGSKELQAHAHNIIVSNNNAYSGQDGAVSGEGQLGNTHVGGVTSTTGTGDGKNMPPYEVKYIWERVA